MKKKFIVILMLVSFILTLGLTGCQKSEEPKNDDGKTEAKYPNKDITMINCLFRWGFQ